MATKLPNWIKQDKNNPRRFFLDPDKFYPGFLKELEGMEAVESEEYPGETLDYKGKGDQNWLEMAFQCFKLDAILAKRNAGIDPWGCENIIEGGEGFKERWGLKHHPQGKVKSKDGVFADADVRKVALQARAVYKKLRGYIPE